MNRQEGLDMICATLDTLPPNTDDILDVIDQITQDGLDEVLFIRLHSQILAEYGFMAGRYRTLPTRVPGLDLPLAYQIPDLMQEIFRKELISLDDVLSFFVDVLESIHPFQDGNRRTCFLAVEATLIHMGYPVFYFGRLRSFWESIHTYAQPHNDRIWRIQILKENIENLTNNIH